MQSESQKQHKIFSMAAVAGQSTRIKAGQGRDPVQQAM